MSVWGQIYADSTTLVGRIMHAVEKRANGIHSTAEWGSTRDDWSDGYADAEHPSMIDGIEAEVSKLIDAELETLRLELKVTKQAEQLWRDQARKANEERDAAEALTKATQDLLKDALDQRDACVEAMRKARATT